MRSSFHLMQVSRRQPPQGFNGGTVGSELWRGSLSDRILIAENCWRRFLRFDPCHRHVASAGCRSPARNADPHPYMDRPLVTLRSPHVIAALPLGGVSCKNIRLAQMLLSRWAGVGMGGRMVTDAVEFPPDAGVAAAAASRVRWHGWKRALARIV